MTRFAQINLAREEVVRHRKWIAEHGTTLEAYRERYGDPGEMRPCEGCAVNGPEGLSGPDGPCFVCDGSGLAEFCYGDGGTAIYQADMQALHKAEERLERLREG